MKILSPRVHGYVDYLVVALFLLAPTLFGFSGVPATLAYVLAAVHAGMTLLTAFPLGVAKIIPFPLHGTIEAVVSAFLLASPWLFGFSYDARPRSFYIASAVLVGIVWLITDYRTVPYPTSTGATPYGRERHSLG